MKRIVISMGLILAACGTRPDGLTYNNPPIEPSTNTPPPPLTKTPTSPSGQPTATPVGPFTGKIADLRKVSRSAGIKVTLSGVIVTGANGNGRTFYVSDADGGEYSGIEIERCSNTDANCSRTDRPVPGQTYDIEGTLFTGSSRNPDHWSIGPAGQVTVTKVTKPPVFVPPTSVTMQTLANKATNAPYRGVYVFLTDERGSAINVTVANVTPAELRNSSWEGDLNLCGDNLQASDTVADCCANGPLYFGFYVRAFDQDLRIATDNYRQANITGFPCYGSKVPFAVRVGDQIAQFAGVFDRDDNSNALFPTADTDYIIRP